MSGGVSPMVLAIVAGCFTLGGVLAKMLFDAVVFRRQDRRATLERFAPERREVYERFLECLRRERRYWDELRKLVEAHARHEEVPQERLESFPSSPMGELTEALDAVRRVARTFQVITAAENVVRLFVDMATATRGALSKPDSQDDLTWFLLQRFSEDREREFVFAYREDLGIGRPTGGPHNYPVRERMLPPWAAEAFLRAHLSARKRERTTDETTEE